MLPLGVVEIQTQLDHRNTVGALRRELVLMQGCTRVGLEGWASVRRGCLPNTYCGGPVSGE